ncbi:MAG: hypothetical protein KAT35_04765 [Candidatus Aenigmarchaeota archaeon]|nr:hypothetical protein [Candidatus Aenigmarchaeota archaeon]
MRPKSGFVTVFGDTPINRLWEFLIDSRGLFDYSMTDMSESADISWNTLKEIFPPFVKQGIVKQTRKIGRATMYIMNEDHPRAVFMTGIHKAISIVFMRGGRFKLEMKVTKDKDASPLTFEVHKSALGPLSA